MKIKLAHICKKLAFLLECRLPIIKSLETMIEDETDKENLEFLKRLLPRLKSGEMISDALPRDSMINSPLIHTMLQNAEYDARLIEGFRIVAAGLEEGTIKLNAGIFRQKLLAEEDQLSLKKGMTIISKVLNPPYGLILICGNTQSHIEATATNLYDLLTNETEVMQPHMGLHPPKFINSTEEMTAALDLSTAGEIVLGTLESASVLSALIRAVNLDGSTSPLTSTAIKVVIFQHVFRAVCETCSTMGTIGENLGQLFDIEPEFPVKEARGCSDCNQSGYSSQSRIIFDFLEPPFELFQMIRLGNFEAASTMVSEELWSRSMLESRELIIKQFTTAQEIKRVLPGNQGRKL